MLLSVDHTACGIIDRSEQFRPVMASMSANFLLLAFWIVILPGYAFSHSNNTIKKLKVCNYILVVM